MTPAPIRLLQLRDAPDAQGELRIGLLVPPRAGSASTRPVLHVYATVSAAVAAKRALEEVADARRTGGGAA